MENKVPTRVQDSSIGAAAVCRLIEHSERRILDGMEKQTDRLKNAFVRRIDPLVTHSGRVCDNIAALTEVVEHIT